MKKNEFKHRMAAHCESGTVSAILSHAGYPISEPMAFGISGGIFFGYFETKQFPFPTFVVRNRPGMIRKKAAKRLGVRFAERSFRDQTQGMSELDRLLREHGPVACQTDFFYMDYLPQHVRVHINVHFVIVVDKDGEDYIISDCYSPELAKLSPISLQKGRFAGGSFAPKGFLFYPGSVPPAGITEKAVWSGIKQASFYMTKLPMPFLGVKGIRMFAKKITGWPKLARNVEHLSHEIMKINVFLEDQGTGGAGFRFMYATFLREASDLLGNKDLAGMSKRMMEIGDEWRRISLFAARIGKKRDLGPDRLSELSSMINKRANEEELFFKDLYYLSKKK
jgi:hypothetical protein